MILYIITTIVLIILGLILTYKTFEYTYTMWKFKNRKKDGSEDKDFRYFD